MVQSGNSKYHVPNLERALQIFELLAVYPAGLTVTEICEHLKIPRNSTYRITNTLVEKGYLVRQDLKKFQLSNKLLEIAYSVIGEQTLVEKALPSMKELRDKIGETVPLGILHGSEGLVIEEVAGTYPFRFVLEPGKKFYLHTAAPGKAILAFLPSSELESIISIMKFEKFNNHTITNPEDYKNYLQKVRNCGYAIDQAEETEGMHCIAAPIFDKRRYPIAAIWITGPSVRLSSTKFENVGEEVKNCAMKISKSFGYGYIGNKNN